MQKILNSGSVVVLGLKWLYSGRSGCIRVKEAVIGQKNLYSGNSGCLRDKVVVFWAKVCEVGAVG